jgi:hypothetical protein
MAWGDRQLRGPEEQGLEAAYHPRSVMWDAQIHNAEALVVLQGFSGK